MFRAIGHRSLSNRSEYRSDQLLDIHFAIYVREEINLRDSVNVSYQSTKYVSSMQDMQNFVCEEISSL